MASRFTDAQRTSAQRVIATAIGGALAVWWVPVVSGLACNAAESIMVKEILAALGRPARAEESDALFWFFRKKYMIVNVITYAPWVGPAVQVMEAFALGQFVLASAEAGGSLSDEAWMESRWAEVEPFIWSGERVVAFYEEFSGGQPFPADIREPFQAAVTFVAGSARVINSVPGVEFAQGVVGEGVRSAVGIAKAFWHGLTE